MVPNSAIPEHFLREAPDRLEVSLPRFEVSLPRFWEATPRFEVSLP
jgi:hypothetical protein